MLASGEHEGAKAILHLTAGLLLGSFAVYNGLAYRSREDHPTHLLQNAWLYTFLTAVELAQASHHWRAASTDLPSA